MRQDNSRFQTPPLSVAVSSITASPLQQLQSSFLDKAKVKLFVKRDDLLHPLFGGNKWRKLKHNLLYAKAHNFDTILTFGGAWSNHIYATAAAGKHFGFNTIGIIRGEEHKPLNTTLTFAKECGMQLHYVDRQQYRQKNNALYQQELTKKFGKIYILPEGGSNTLAMQGCEDVIQEINAQIEQPFDVICCASGTGATIAGIISAIEKNELLKDKTAIGFSALKNGEFLIPEVNNFLNEYNKNRTPNTNWRIECDFHFGGYAKINDELISFMKAFELQYNITLDAVYTAKMFFGLFELIKKNKFKPNSVIIAVHSGGLQGNKGFNL